MRLPLVLVLGLSLALAAGTAGGDDRIPQPPKDGHVKVRVEVEVRGLLLRTNKGFTVSSRLKVYQLHDSSKELPQSARERPADVYDYDFARSKELRELAEALKGKEVVVNGMSELRMVDQTVAPGGGSGLGPPQPFPVPTWTLQNTVLVTGLKSVRTADVAPAAEPKADDDKQVSTTYDSPQTVFDAAVAAEKREDARIWIGCLTPETRKQFAGKLAYAAVVAQHLVHDYPSSRLKGAGQFQPLLGPLEKYGLTYDVTKKISAKADAGPEERRKAAAELTALMKDPTGLAAELVKAYSTGELSHHKPEDLFAVEHLLQPLKDWSEPKLIDVKIDGDKATGFIYATVNDAETKAPIRFLKVGGGWWLVSELEQAEEPAAAAARRKQERLQGAWSLMEPVSLVGASPPRSEPYSPSNLEFVKEEIRFSYNVSLRVNEQTEFGDHAAYRLDSSKAPKQIDLAISEGKWAGKNLPGIYLLAGDVLIVALSTEEGKRPREFTNIPESGQRLLVFHRAKPKE